MTAAAKIEMPKGTTPANAAAGALAIYPDTTLSKFLCTDESGNISTVAGVGTNIDYRIIKVTTVVQGTTTYTPSAGCRAIFVEGWGAGAGAAGCQAATNTSVGNPGGGGGYSFAFLTPGNMGITLAQFQAAWTCVVGLGGTGGAGNADGVTGTDTTLTDSTSVGRLTAKGGVKGTTANGIAAGTAAAMGGAAGAGGAAGSGVGDAKFGGGAGKLPIRLAAGVVLSGAGGDCPMGGAGGESLAAAGTGNAGAFPGGGGGAPFDTANTSRTGGGGANGLLKITEYA